MIVISPLVLAGASGGLTFLQGMMGHQARAQDHVNQVAMQKASDEFAGWTASRNAQQQDLNNDYAFWQQKINWGQDVVHANQLRNYELSKSIQQAENVFRTRASAGADYAQASAAITDEFAQQSMADAVSLMQYKQQALRSQASVMAGGTEGQSVDRYINDYARQLGDMETMKELNQQFRERQFTRDQAGQVAQYLNRYNSQQLYERQDIQDPIMPFAPLPTLINPAGPSFTGAAPSASTAFLGSAIGAFKDGLSTHTMLSKSA